MRGLKTVVAVIVLSFGLCSLAHGRNGEAWPEPASAAVPGEALLALHSAPPVSHKQAKPAAPAFTHNARLLFTGLWGTTTNETSFDSGVSRLEWPLDAWLVGGAYQARYKGIAEWEIFVEACPWNRSNKTMRDSDALVEEFPPFHEGTDIFSQSTVDTKAFVFGTSLRVFALSYRYASVGFTMAYQGHEMDFKARDTVQTGYGPWTSQTGSISGPTSTYTVNYHTYALGLTCRLLAGDTASLTLDASVIPYAKATDEDNHLLRLRTSENDCDGSGSMLSMNAQMALGTKWFVSTSCTRLRIDTDGHQSQFWYGNDPASPGDETGSSVVGIDSEMEQDSFTIGLSLGCKL